MINLNRLPPHKEEALRLLDLPFETLRCETCAELRQRIALWRADPTIPPAEAEHG